MRIGIDCRLSGKRHAGIGRYIENLVTRLPKISKGVEWVFFFYDQKQADEVLGDDLKKNENVKVVLVPFLHYSLSEQIQLPRVYKKNKLDLLYVPHFNVPLLYGGKLAITIHDLLWHQHRGPAVTTLKPWEYWLKYVAYRFISGRAIKKAKVVFVPTNTIKNTVLSYYPEAKNKIVVTKEGVGDKFRPEISVGTNLNPPQKPSKNLLYVGSLYPHKNIQLVLNSLKQLSDYNLTIVGARSVFRDKVEKSVDKLELKKRVFLKGYLSDSQLLEEYGRAFALVQPSLSEGFGLTGVEAMSIGVPVLASDIPVFREIYQDAAIYFDPQSTESFIRAVENLSKSDRAKVIEKGQKVAKTYSWDKMAEETLIVLTKLP